MENSRRFAALALMKWMATKDDPATLLPDGEGRQFVQDLVYTAIRRRRTLEFALAGFVRQWPKGELENLLLIGAAQILFMPSVPDFAAVGETVKAAKHSSNPSVPRVVNGVLRNLIRRRAEVEAHVAAAPLAVRESFPDALVARWTKAFGADNTASLCAWYNRPAETFLAFPDGSFRRLERGRRVQDEPGYASGGFIVQDPGTRLAVGLVGANPSERILDACAAPGGKTIQLAWRGARVTACEVNPKRRARLTENLVRTCLEDKVAVIGGFAEADAPFDKVLVDAPCSNTGVMRRRADARWNWSERKLSELVELQAGILARAAALCRPGGLVVYSTCSIEREENEEQVARFLASHPGAKLERTELSLPFASGTDGAFAAAIRLGAK